MESVRQTLQTTLPGLKGTPTRLGRVGLRFSPRPPTPARNGLLRGRTRSASSPEVRLDAEALTPGYRYTNSSPYALGYVDVQRVFAFSARLVNKSYDNI